MPTENWGDFPYYYPAETTLEIGYTVAVSGPEEGPAEDATVSEARIFYATPPSSPDRDPDETSELVKNGSALFDLDLSGYTAAEHSPLLVIFHFTKEFTSGPKAGTTETTEVPAGVMLAEPEVGTIQMEIEGGHVLVGDAAPGETVVLVVTEWGAQVFEDPGADPVFEGGILTLEGPTADYARISDTAKSQVCWYLDGEIQTSGQESLAFPIPADTPASSMEFTCYRLEDYALGDPGTRASCTVHVIVLEIVDEDPAGAGGECQAAPEKLLVGESVMAWAKLGAEVEGEFSWTLEDGGQTSFDGSTSVLEATGPSVEIFGQAESAAEEDVTLRLTFTSAATGKTYQTDAKLTVYLAEIRLVDDNGNPADTSPATVKTSLEISNRRTTVDLPAGFATASTDRDNFKIELKHPTAAGNTIAAADVEIETLKPDGTSFNPRRVLQVELQKVAGSADLFRSRYLRLVTDELDQAANAAQTVLTDWDSTDESVEILGQIVRAKYGLATTQADVGGATRSKIRLALHVMRTAPGGAGVVTEAQAKTRINQWFRRVYAQISMAPRILSTASHDPLENLVSISNDNGANATGGGSQISFTIRATRTGAADKVQAIGPYAPGAGDTPMTTANGIVALIQAQPDFNVRTVQNPPTLEAAVTQGSADLIITDPAGGRVTIEGLAANDATQTVTVGRVNSVNFVGWGGTAPRNWVVGSIMQRTLLQAYDTGADRIDLFVIGSFANRGEAMIPGSFYAAGKQALPAVTLSAFLQQNVMDGTASNPWSCPHEAGHVMMDVIHVTGDATQLMTGTGTSGTHAEPGSKRFSDVNVNFDSPAIAAVQEARIRSQGAAVLEAF